MSHKHVGPIGWEFSGDKTRCFQLIGPARLLAQQALDKIAARGGRGQQIERRRLADGSTIRVQVILNFETPVVRAYIQAPEGGSSESEQPLVLESGLLAWHFPLEDIPYPLSIQVEGDLVAYFAGDGPYLQGAITLKKTDDGAETWSFASAPPEIVDGAYDSAIYATPEQHKTILSAYNQLLGGSAMDLAAADPRLASTRYSGWMRLFIQAIAGSNRTLDDVLGGYALTFDTGLLVSPAGEFWLAQVSRDGAAFTKMELSELSRSILDWVRSRHTEVPIVDLPWPTDQTTRLALCYVLLGLSVPSEQTVVQALGCADSAYADGMQHICMHGWQWNRASTQAVVVTRKWQDEQVSCVSALSTLTLDWSGENTLPRPVVSTDLSGPWRINPFFHYLWLPIGTPGVVEVLYLDIPKPPFWDGSFDQFAGAVGYIHAFFDSSDTLQTLKYSQYTGDYQANRTTITGNECYRPGGGYTERYESQSYRGAGGFSGRAGACYESWGSRSDIENRTIIIGSYDTKQGYLKLGSEAFRYRYCQYVSEDDKCYGNNGMWEQIKAIWANGGTYICFEVSGVTFTATRKVTTQPSGGARINQALVVSAFDPTVYFELQTEMVWSGTQRWSFGVKGAPANFGSAIGWTGWYGGPDGQCLMLGPDDGPPIQLCSGGNLIGGNLGWGGTTTESEGSEPGTDSFSYTGQCIATKSYALEDSFPNLFTYNLLDPATGIEPANAIFGHSSAGGVDTYTTSRSGGENNQNYPFAYSRYPARALWLGGA